MSPGKNKPLEFPQVLLVEASAGSGKTYTLAKRYIQLLIGRYCISSQIPLNQILAITFTNKAAIEMKERILEFLKKTALDQFRDLSEKHDILDALGLDEDAARKKAHLAMDFLVRNYNFFQVQTIDSFINAILCGCAFKLELSANFKTEDDYRRYLAYSLDKLIDRAATDNEVMRIIQGFLHQYLYVENKTSWFPKQNILEIMENIFSKSNKHAGVFIRSQTEAKDLKALKKKIIDLINVLPQVMPEGVNKSFLKSLDNFFKKNKENFDIDKLSEFFKKEFLPLNKGASASKEAETLWQKIRQALEELCLTESSSAFNYYIDIFNRLHVDLRHIASHDDVLFLEALNKEAYRLFDEDLVGPPEIYYRLATRFKHFLLDEFQDTSYLQWQNLKPMVEEALSTDGSLFYVGDKKQAIYRFRGGEAELINSVKERFQGFNFIQQNLNINYRSRKEIVEFNNSVFSEANLARFFSSKEEAKKGGIEFSDEDIQEIIEVFGDSRQSFRPDNSGGYVQSEFLDYRTRQEAEDALRGKLIALLNDLHKRFAYGDMVLLARENSQVELLTGWLLAENIPVESEKTLDIRQNAYIKELVSFLRFLNSPIDDLSFASFILGDIFLKASGLDIKVIQDFLFSLQVKKQKGVYIYREFRLQFSGLWDELIEDFFKNVGFVPLYELMISIFHKFRVMNDFAGYQGFFMRLLEMIKTEEEDNFSIAGFLESFDKPGREGVYVNASESDAVKIITIHKSKGLEFPVVVLPFLEMNVRTDNECLVADGLELKLIRLKKKYADFSPALERLYRDGYIKSFIDELNNMYVSFTRAKDELYIFVSCLAQNSFNLAQIFLPENNFTRGVLVPDHIKTRAAKPSIEIPPSQYKDWIGILKDEFIDEGVILGRENIKRGEVLHYLLSCIGNLPVSGFEPEIQEALKRARVKFPFINDLSGYKAVMDKLLADKILGGYFRFEHGQVYREKEIIDHLGLTKRIDRLLVNSHEAVVIDYKSSRDPSGRYSAQVKEYMSIIGQIYPEKNVRGVLVYLDDLSVEEVETGNNTGL